MIELKLTFIPGKTGEKKPERNEFIEMFNTIIKSARTPRETHNIQCAIEFPIRTRAELVYIKGEKTGSTISELYR